MIHAYSLIHDDLPAMDDDDLRRGRPTCHRAFDEATAILAGDALQALAYEILTDAHCTQLPVDIRVAMLRLLTQASGAHGMAGGQAVDLASVGIELNLDQLEAMHRLKTGALIRASILLGAMCNPHTSAEQLDMLDKYACCIGLSYQIVDDILDVIGDTETLGKPQGSDMAQQKPTYPSVLGIEASKQRALEQHQQALAHIESAGCMPRKACANCLPTSSNVISDEQLDRHPLLERIDTPEDLRRLDESQLPRLARELRSFLLESVSSTGGHLSAGLGTIELTIALHYVFNTPHDHLVWDVGHQTYPHKILTGRKHRMPSLRQRGGLAGFPKRGESEFDAFGTGHSSTSISAALGMCIADAQRGLNKKSIAVIGDGAMTAGMAFEALNHAGDTDADLLVILNDNDMSISANVGGLSNHLTRLLSGSLYSTIREGGKRVLENLPGPVHELARRTEEHVKGMVAPGTLFEELGFNYFGPIDGHDLSTLLPTLRNLAQQNGPRLLHVVTRKGKGYFPAEDDPSKYHGVGSFDTSTGEAQA